MLLPLSQLRQVAAKPWNGMPGEAGSVASVDDFCAPNLSV